ncbi:hypothetical protein X732_29035 [Mesorhizobium sp. L2C066B000]|nr:hypothetical protein X732_29035 [Mesorhizobium sp. L2C066B000]
MVERQHDRTECRNKRSQDFLEIELIFRDFDGAR